MTTTTAPSGGTRGQRTVYTVLLSVCLFLGVLCVCLLVALVLVGRNLVAQSLQQYRCRGDDNGENHTHTPTTITMTTGLTDNGTTPEDEISVRINVTRAQSSTSTTLRPPLYVTTPTPDWRSGWRLPRDVTPLHYDLELNPQVFDGSFSGVVNITVNVTEPRDHIVLHGHLLNVTAVAVHSADGVGAVEVLQYHDDTIHQLWVVDFEDTLKPGLYYLGMEFHGSMKDRRVGLYSSTYLDENDNKRYIATSKLEPTYARQVFPCFDEPNFKAKYTVHLVKPNDKKYIALSNMDQVGPPKYYDQNSVKVSFNTSVPMSTYVTCFIVCDFDYKMGDGEHMNMKVYAAPAQIDKTEFALSVAEKVSKYYVGYFGLEYPLPKLDLIAIPDFVSGAMEHWGLVTFRETALLYDHAKSSTANKQRVATVVAHELAHMWFGNLVTLDWWDDLWLNEGFATYMQFKAIDQNYPDFGMSQQFLIDELHPVMKFDATLASHPIVKNVVTPDQITEIFDTISYNKGASVLRMLENAIGEDNFKQGIQSYLKKYQFKNAETKNLWEELQTNATGFQVEDVMDTWTTQMGYPVVNVQPNDKKDGFILTQKRFLANPDNEVLSDNSYVWTIPITYKDSSENKSKLIWFDKTMEKIEVKSKVPIKFNLEQVGYYRVNYDESTWKLLIEKIGDLSIGDRANLLEDAFSLSWASQLSYNITLDLTNYLKNETEYVPWFVAATKLKELKLLLETFDFYFKLQSHVRAITESLYKKLTWHENVKDSHTDRLLRVKLLDLACSFGYDECLHEASSLFNDWLSNKTTLSVDTKLLVYQYGMINVNEDDWNAVFEMYIKEIDAQEKLRLLKGLASSSNIVLLNRLLEKAKNEDIVRSQDYFTCLQFISNNPVGTTLIWDYVRENWEYLVTRFTLNDRYLGRLIPTITSSFSSNLKLIEMKEFFKKYPDAGAGEISRKEALETVSVNIKWLTDNKEQVEAWFKNFKPLV